MPRQTPSSTHTTTQQKMSCVCLTGHGRRGCTSSSDSCMLQVRFNLTWWDPGLLHPSIPKSLSRYLLPNAKTHLHGRNYSVYSLHNIVILGTFVRCKQNLFGTTCFFILPGWHAVVPDCWRRCATWFHSLFLMSFWSSGGSAALNSSRKSTLGKAKVCSIGLTQRHRNQSVQCKYSMNHEWNGLVHRNHWCFCFSRSNRRIQCFLAMGYIQPAS